MDPQNSLVSLMANYHDSEDDEGADENVQNNINFLNFNSSQLDKPTPGSLKNNNIMSNVPAQNISFEKSIENSNNVESQSASHLNSQFEIDNDILFPPEPTGSCALTLQDKITKLYQKIEAGQLDMNQWIQEHKDFRNPSIYEKLIGFCNIDELGTNYPSDKFNPSQWSEDSFYDKLAVAQNEKMKKLMGKK